MEKKLLAGVLATETHTRLAIGDQVFDYFRDENNLPEEFEDFDMLISGLAAWMGSSHFKVCVFAMEIVTLLVSRMKDRFRPHITTVFPPIRERLGDGKDQVREKTQTLIQQILQDSVASPQVFLDKLMDGTLAHKNWRVKEQGLKCLSRTLDFFGSGQITVGKFIGRICDLLGDANSQVRSAAIDSMVVIYRHVGVKVRIDLEKRGLPPARMQQLFNRFDELDSTTNHISRSCGEPSDESVESETTGSSSPTHTKPTNYLAPGLSSANKGKVSTGALDNNDFDKGFSDIPRLNILTVADVEKTVSSIEHTLANPKNDWNNRVTALKELRALAQISIVDSASFIMLLRPLERPMRESLKDLRSQVVREAAITLSCLCVQLRTEMAQFIEQLLPQLVSLLPNSAKVMSSSANVCINFIIKHSPHHRLLVPLLQGILTSKSPITRRCCAELVNQAVISWDSSLLEKQASLLEETLTKGLKDADPSARKHMRKVYWGYHSHFPVEANRIFESCDSQQQKLLSNERKGGDKNIERSTTISPKLKIIRKPNAQPELVRIDQGNSLDSLPPRPPSASAVVGRPPSIKVRPPTVRSAAPIHAQTSNSLSAASRSISRSTENLASSNTTSTPSHNGRGGGTVHTNKSSASEFKRPRTPVRASRSARTSPISSREVSPVRTVPKSASMSRKYVPLTAESLKMTYDSVSSRGDDDDDCGSVTSERSAFSISSEMSISPYACAKFPNPVTDLDELVKLCSNRQWSDRRDGIAQLHLLMESGRPLTHDDLVKVKEVFKRMFSEPHSKVYGMFLETLTRFIECHREYMDEWLFLMLLQLLHKQGSDMLKSVQFKLQIVLEEIRKTFEVDRQFSELCRILVDPQRPMNHKVKLAWLDYLNELLPSMEASDFTDCSDTRQAFTKLLGLTIDPKSAEMRRVSQQIVAALFDLNTATFSIMSRNLPTNLRESSDRIVRSHLQNEPTASPDVSPTPSPISSTMRNKGYVNSPKSISSYSTTSSLHRLMSSSSPDITLLPPTASLPVSSLTPTTPRSRIPTPSSSSSGRKGRSRIPLPRSSVKQVMVPPRAMSVDPEQMLNTHTFEIHRPTSSQSVHASLSRRPNTDLGFVNTTHNSSSRPPSSQGFMLDHFITHLPVLDFGAAEAEAEPKDQVALLLKQLVNAANVKLKIAALQGLHTLARAYDHSNWEDHLSSIVPQLLTELQLGDESIQAHTLRLLRELLKNPLVHSSMAPFTASLTTAIIKAYSSSELNISQLAEDLFGVISSSLPSQTMVEQLGPLVAHETEATLLASIKLLTKVVVGTSKQYLSSMLPEIAPGVVQGYCHTESKVRKASVFCLVALYSVVGEDLRPHLAALSSAQTKLLNLYIRRQEDGKMKSTSEAYK